MMVERWKCWMIRVVEQMKNDLLGLQRRKIRLPDWTVLRLGDSKVLHLVGSKALQQQMILRLQTILHLASCLVSSPRFPPRHVSTRPQTGHLQQTQIK